ncbi:DUF1802 family protein [Oculatella sp. LEGE 06141]|uniref:DUF1802 family protein n=1 Tax=Oculatella sp. LEGE 06141 TaxID=1828648 RepID=UPI0018815CF2|nr:DUF1802 family protein [Oculatella sp. LEGE 06141]MBE9181672.1 DUF1802 family protein [Oculatella sp. LEGE 06141]
MDDRLTPALKEWAIAVSALTQGDTILLLRKGGIREQGGRFSVAQHRVWLYPTYEHQKPHLLKPAYADRVQPVASGWHPSTVAIPAWAEITHVFQFGEAATVSALLPFHIWNEQFATERLKWKPRQPLYALLLRVHRLHTTHTLSYREEYGGCKSWIDLQEPLSTAASVPVWSDDEYARQVDQIGKIISQHPPTVSTVLP